MCAFVGGFSSVVETIRAATRLAAEGEKVELAAKLVLAVAADRLEVGVGHGREAGVVCHGGCGQEAGK